MRNSRTLILIPFYSENIGKENSYTISIDVRTNKLYRFEESKLNLSWFLPLFLLFLISTRLFSMQLIPLNNLPAFVVMSLFLYSAGLILGNVMRKIGIKNIRRMTLKEGEWDCYRKKSIHFYPRQLAFACLMLILPIVCFISLYSFPTKWWFFGGILSSVFAGNLLPFLSKTRYLLYKNKLDIKLSENKENEMCDSDYK